MIVSKSVNQVAYIGLGSNLGDRVVYLRSAIGAIGELGKVIRISSVYETEPIDVDEGQPKYLNMTIAILTEFSPESLLSRLLEVEWRNGRVRNQPNESRTLDIDLLSWVMNSATIPNSSCPIRACMGEHS